MDFKFIFLCYNVKILVKVYNYEYFIKLKKIYDNANEYF